jgi:chromate transporter
VFITFFTLGLYAFGGPTAHFALFRKTLAERRRWLSPAEYDAYLALCQFLPGPGSSQMAAVLGWVRAGPFGAVLAMAAFAIPSVVLMGSAGFALPLLDPAVASGAIAGLLAAVAAVVAGAVWAMGRTTARHPLGLALATVSAACVLIATQQGVSVIWLQPALIALAALAGGILLRTKTRVDVEAGDRTVSAKVGVLALISFATLLLGLPFLTGLGAPFVLADIVYRSGALVFGGGHVVLPLLKAGTAPELVSEASFLAGYGLAQAVPGPLFSFAAFIGAAAGEGLFGAICLALLAAVMVFLPGLLLVFAILPVWARIKAWPRAQGAILGAAAGATGLLAAAFVDPVLTSLPVDWRIYGLALAAFVALQGAKVPPPLIIAACAVAGVWVA